MKRIKRNYRSWWQTPRKAGELIEDRQVTFLELFYDLVYVLLIARLAHSLADHFSLVALANFALLYAIVWWAWINGAVYHDVHGNNDLRTRIFTFLQMIPIAFMAFFAHDAIGSGSIGFALSFAVFQLILALLWWRTGVHDKNHRSLSAPYTLISLLNTLLFAGSVFIAEPMRYHIWTGSVVFVLLAPLFLQLLGKLHIGAKTQLELTSQTSSSLVERFGLFTIIVLGEVIVGTVLGASASHHMTLATGLGLLFGVLIAVCAWWIYFDLVSHKKPKKGRSTYFSWMYVHIPLTFSIVLAGALLSTIISHLDEGMSVLLRTSFVLALAAILLSVAALNAIVRHEKSQQHISTVVGRMLLVSAVLLLLLSQFSISGLYVLLISVLLMLAPIAVAFVLWASRLNETA